MGNVNIQFFDGVVKNIPPTTQKKLLSVGFIVDQNHSIEFLSKGCFLGNCYTRELVAFDERENGKDLYQFQG
jgi:hypothetical protein